MTIVTIAQRYANAIFELAVESDQVKSVTEELEDIAEVYSTTPSLQAILSNPQVDPEERSAILAELGKRLGLGTLAVNALRVIAQRRRLDALVEIARQLKAMADARAGVLRATITSAAPLSAAYRAELVAHLEKSTERKILAEFGEDPALIAGVITRIGDYTLDGSIRGRLADIERQLLQA